MTDPEQPAPRTVLYGRAGCHLCDDARAVVARVCAERGERYVEIDVDGDPLLLACHGDAVPVVVVDGVQVGFWRIEPARLAAALDRPPI